MMMRYKARIAAFFLAAVMMITLTGCQLAREDAGTSKKEDRLIGVFLTTEYLDLFDMEGYLNDNTGRFAGDGEIVIDGTSEKYQGRLYAELQPKTLTDAETGEKTVTQEYVFPGVKGIPYFSATIPAAAGRESYITSGSDEAISDGHMSLNCGDKGNSIVMDGTVYLSSGHARTYYFNPVYQSSDGRVYALAGNGLSSDSVQAEGSVLSQTMDATYTTAEKGKSVTDSISVKISISVMNPPSKITVLQMGTDSSVILRTEYMPGEMPKTIVPEKDTEYFVVETCTISGGSAAPITRKLYGKDDTSLEAFYSREDGICVKQWVQVNWGQ